MTRIPFANPEPDNQRRLTDSDAKAIRVSLSCPNCGSTSFEASPESKSFEEHNGATCLICGTFLTVAEASQRIGKKVDTTLRGPDGADPDSDSLWKVR